MELLLLFSVITPWFSFLTFVFWQKKLYSQDDEAGVLEVLEIIFSAAQPRWADFYKMFPFILQFGSSIFMIYFKMKRLKNI